MWECFWPLLLLFLVVYAIWIFVPNRMYENYTPFGSLMGREALMLNVGYPTYGISDMYTGSYPVYPNYYPNLYFPGWYPYGNNNYSYRSWAF